jgi:5S rRNA maturation endonuclease (ribonuclease M5)
MLDNYLQSRKITPEVRDLFGIYLDNNIVIPVKDLEGNFSYNKYRRNPLSEEGPKYFYDKGGKTTLYGWHLAKGFEKILITEGELDTLVAWSHNIPAITSTSGANSFQAEWAELLKDKEIIVCFDNDEAGANGMVKVLESLPNAKILLLPDRPRVKDITDYVASGGDLETLMKTAKHFKDITEVTADREVRSALCGETYFHDAYIKAHTKVAPKNVPFKSQTSDKVTRAKEYPISNLMEFKHNKAICPFHNEKSGSFTYYPENNTAYCFGCSKVADSIEVYKKLNDCSFMEAVEEINKLL